MDLKQLQYFVTAADEGSISGAARRLFITQPPVSVQIQQLEKELGGPLVIRGGRRLELTPAGHELYRHATLLCARCSPASTGCCAWAWYPAWAAPWRPTGWRIFAASSPILTAS